MSDLLNAILPIVEANVLNCDRLGQDKSLCRSHPAVTTETVAVDVRGSNLSITTSDGDLSRLQATPASGSGQSFGSVASNTFLTSAHQPCNKKLDVAWDLSGDRDQDLTFCSLSSSVPGWYLRLLHGVLTCLSEYFEVILCGQPETC